MDRLFSRPLHIQQRCCSSFKFRTAGSGNPRDTPPQQSLKDAVYSRSPRVTRRHTGPEEPSPALRLHGMGAAEAEAVLRGKRKHLNSAHLATHTAAEKAAALVAGERLQPRSNPHIKKLLADFLLRPNEDRFSKLLSELTRGPLFVFVSEAEMALRESEVRAAALNHAQQGSSLPSTVSFSPLIFSERDADKLEDGDALMIKRRIGTLAPDYTYKRGTAFVSVYTDVAALEEATTHPYLKSTGIDRVSFVGVHLRNILPWILREMPVRVFLNKYTETEAELAKEDVQGLAEYVQRVQQVEGTLADFTPVLQGDSETIMESWNENEDRRTEYTRQRRRVLEEKRRGVLGEVAAERELQCIAAALGSKNQETEEVTKEEQWQCCPPHAAAVVVAALVQRPEVRSASAAASPDSASLLLGIDSSDFDVSCSKVAAVFEYFRRGGVVFPALHAILPLQQFRARTPSADYTIYDRPADLALMGRKAQKTLAIPSK